MTSNAKLLEVWLAADKKCLYCGVQTKLKSHSSLRRATVDHYMPKALGGTNDDSNLVLSCEPCNMLKGRMHPKVFCRGIAHLVDRLALQETVANEGAK